MPRLDTVKDLADWIARQNPPKLGPAYIPGIKASVREAPPSSNSFTLPCRSVGRVLHALSEAELHLFVLAAFHPRMVALHEELILPMSPRVGFLGPYIGSEVAFQKETLGTVTIAMQIGQASLHPTKWLLEADGSKTKMPIPMVGDLLIVLDDELGRYAVNWTIRDKADHFIDSQFPKYPRNRTRQLEKEAFRHRVEEILFLECGVRTHRVSADMLDIGSMTNLRRMMLAAQAEDVLVDESRAILVAALKSIVGTPTSLADLAAELTHLLGVGIDTIRNTICAAIWTHEVKVDLSHPVLMDDCLRNPRCCFLSQFEHLFLRGTA